MPSGHEGAAQALGELRWMLNVERQTHWRSIAAILTRWLRDQRRLNERAHAQVLLRHNIMARALAIVVALFGWRVVIRAARLLNPMRCALIAACQKLMRIPAQNEERHNRDDESISQ